MLAILPYLLEVIDLNRRNYYIKYKFVNRQVGEEKEKNGQCYKLQ